MAFFLKRFFSVALTLSGVLFLVGQGVAQNKLKVVNNHPTEAFEFSLQYGDAENCQLKGSVRNLLIRPGAVITLSNPGKDSEWLTFSVKDKSDKGYYSWAAKEESCSGRNSPGKKGKGIIVLWKKQSNRISINPYLALDPSS